MDDVNNDPVQGVPGGEDGTLGPDISDEALNHYLDEFKEKDEYLLLLDSPSFVLDLDDPRELAGPQGPPQPDHPPPRAPELPHSQGKFEKRCLISKVDEKAIAGVDGIVPEMDEEVPMCDGVPKGKAEVPFSAKNINLTALDGDKGVPIWTSFFMDDSQAGGVPTSATSYPAYSGGSLPETGVPSSAAVPMSAGIEREVPAITSANPSTEPQGARAGSQAISYITSSAVREVSSTSAPQMSSGTQASSASNSVPGNERTVVLKICGTNIALPISMRHLVIQSGTDNGTTGRGGGGGGGGGGPPNPMAGTPLTSNQPSTSKIYVERNTGRKIKEEKEDEEEEEEEEGERESAGGKRQIGKTQRESKRKRRRRQSKKQTEEEEEEEKLPPRYQQPASNDPVEERKRKDAIRAWKVRERKKNKMAELENENERLKEEIEERDRLQKEKEEKYQEEIDRLRREKEGLTAQVEEWKTWVAKLVTTLREQFNIFVASQGPS